MVSFTVSEITLWLEIAVDWPSWAVSSTWYVGGSVHIQLLAKKSVQSVSIFTHHNLYPQSYQKDQVEHNLCHKFGAFIMEICPIPLKDRGQYIFAGHLFSPDLTISAELWCIFIIPVFYWFSWWSNAFAIFDEKDEKLFAEPAGWRWESMLCEFSWERWESWESWERWELRTRNWAESQSCAAPLHPPLPTTCASRLSRPKMVMGHWATQYLHHHLKHRKQLPSLYN